MNQSNLVNLDTFLLLQGLFHCQDLIFWFKIEGLVTPGQSLDKNLPLIKTPKIAIYFVFLAARLASFIGINRGQFGLNLYRNLLSNESDLMESGSLIYEVADGVTLESELPKIISSHGQD